MTLSLVWLLLSGSTANAETIDWTTIPRQGGGTAWNNNGPSATPPAMATQTFVNIDGTPVGMTVRYSGNMWDNNSVPNIYGSSAPVPIEAFRRSLRWTNNLADNEGVPSTTIGPTLITIEFSEPILLDDFTVVSLSRLLLSSDLPEAYRYEWMDISVYGENGIFLIADSAQRSTYTEPDGILEVRENSPLIELLTGLYRVRGTSRQCNSAPCGYDRLTLSYLTTPVKRIEIVHFVTDGETSGDPRSRGMTSVAIEPIVFSLPAAEYDWGDAPDTGSGNGANNYSTLESSDGPRHLLVDGIRIGSVIDSEPDGQQSPNADGDDINPVGAEDDEEGVIIADLALTESQDAIVRVNVTNLGDLPAILYGWIDFDGNGLFELGEQTQVPVPAGSNDVQFSLNFGPTPPGSAPATFARFRLSTDTSAASPTGDAQDGEVEDHPTTIASAPVEYDWSDAPDSGIGNGSSNYNTLANDYGPRHIINNELTIGAVIDSEADGQPNTNADGDDLNPTSADDEDGVLVTDLSLVEGNVAAIRVNVNNQTSTSAALYGWIDFNGNGIFEANERTQIAVPTGASNQQISLNFGTTPINGVSQTYARFRLSSDSRAANPVGEVNDGEVEDYLVTIQLLPPQLDWGDAPDTGPEAGSGNYATLAEQNGPSHAIVDGLRLGAAIDSEENGQPMANAEGDDTNPPNVPDDEDGVFVDDLQLHLGLSAPVRVNVTNLTQNAAILYGWIDFNGNGDFEASERATAPVTPGAASQQVVLDFGATPLNSVARTFARFRLSSDGAAAVATGPASDGEIEDYPVTIEAIYDWGDAPDGADGTGIGNYNTRAGDNGPSHQIVDGLFLGAVVDDEADGQPTVVADGDDASPPSSANDEDGIDASDLTLVGGQPVEVKATVTNLGDNGAILYGWIDFNTNGVFELTERASVTIGAGQADNVVILDFGPAPVPDSVVQTYARFRLSTDDAAASAPIASASDGEVEDYPVTISPAPAAVDLVGFSAAYSEEAVGIYWQSASEVDTTGFNLYRSTTGQIEDAVRINPSLVPSLGANGGDYVFVDKSVIPGLNYYYWLVEVERNAESAIYGPTIVTTQPSATQFSLFLPAIVH